MEINVIMDFISTVGFPIFIAVFFLLQNAKQDERFANQFDKMNDAIANNTKALQELTIFIKQRGDN